MKQLALTLIRRHIRTLYPDPIVVTLGKKRGVQAAVITLVVYSIIFMLLAQIEIQPSRTVELYPSIAVTVLPSTEVDLPESDPAAAISDGAEDPVSESGDGVFSPNSEPGLEQVDSGDENADVEVLPTNDLPSLGVGEIESEGVSNFGEKEKVTKVQIKGSDQKPVFIKPEPEIDSAEEPIVEAIAEPAKDPDKPVAEHDAKPEIRPGRGNIMPAYIVDRAPRISNPGRPVFPEEFDDQVFDYMVLLRVVLNELGEAVHVEPLNEVELAFRESAINLILSSSFEPAYVGNVAVPCMFDITVEFLSYYEEES